MGTYQTIKAEPHDEEDHQQTNDNCRKGSGVVDNRKGVTIETQRRSTTMTKAETGPGQHSFLTPHKAPDASLWVSKRPGEGEDEDHYRKTKKQNKGDGREAAIDLTQIDRKQCEGEDEDHYRKTKKQNKGDGREAAIDLTQIDRKQLEVARPIPWTAENEVKLLKCFQEYLQTRGWSFEKFFREKRPKGKDSFRYFFRSKFMIAHPKGRVEKVWALRGRYEKMLRLPPWKPRVFKTPHNKEIFLLSEEIFGNKKENVAEKKDLCNNEVRGDNNIVAEEEHLCENEICYDRDNVADEREGDESDLHLQEDGGPCKEDGVVHGREASPGIEADSVEILSESPTETVPNVAEKKDRFEKGGDRKQLPIGSPIQGDDEVKLLVCLQDYLRKRVWTAADFSRPKAIKEYDAFFLFVKERVGFAGSPRVLEEKIGTLRRRYQKMVGSMEEGKPFLHKTPHSEQVFRLSMEIWGDKNKGLEEINRRENEDDSEENGGVRKERVDGLRRGSSSEIATVSGETKGEKLSKTFPSAGGDKVGFQTSQRSEKTEKGKRRSKRKFVGSVSSTLNLDELIGDDLQRSKTSKWRKTEEKSRELDIAALRLHLERQKLDVKRTKLALKSLISGSMS